MTNSRQDYESHNEPGPLSEKAREEVDAFLLDFCLRNGLARREDDGEIKYFGIPDTPEPEIARLGSVPGGDAMDAILANMPTTSSHKDRCRALLLGNFTTREIALKLRISDALVTIARKQILRDVEMGLIKPDSLPLSVTNPRALNYERHGPVERPDMKSIDGQMNPNHPMAVAARSQHRSVAEIAQDAVAHRVNARYQAPSATTQAAKGDEIAAQRKRDDAVAAVVPTPEKKTPSKKRGPRTFKYTAKPPPFPSDDK